MLINQIIPAAMCSGIDLSKKKCLSLFFSIWKYTRFWKVKWQQSIQVTTQSRSLVVTKSLTKTPLLLNAIHWNYFLSGVKQSGILHTWHCLPVLAYFLFRAVQRVHVLRDEFKLMCGSYTTPRWASKRGWDRSPAVLANCLVSNSMKCLWVCLDLSSSRNDSEYKM